MMGLDEQQLSYHVQAECSASAHRVTQTESCPRLGLAIARSGFGETTLTLRIPIVLKICAFVSGTVVELHTWHECFSDEQHQQLDNSDFCHVSSLGG